MKKKFLTLSVFLLSLFIACDVSAETFKKGDTFIKHSDGNKSVPGLSYGGKGFSTYHYSFTWSGDNQPYVTYCMDPHKGSGKNYSIDRILGDSSMSLYVQAHDLGVLEILKYGKANFNNSFSVDKQTPESLPGNYVDTISGDELYSATSIALRAFSLGLFGFGGPANYKNGQALASAQINAGILWNQWVSTEVDSILGTKCNTSDKTQVVKCYTNRLKSQYSSWYKTDIRFAWGAYKSESYRVIYAAQDLYYKGVKKAYDVIKNGANVSNVKLEIKKNKEMIERTETVVKEYHYGVFTITDLDAEKGYVKVDTNISCPSCSGNGASIFGIEYQNPANNEWEALSSETDIAANLPVVEGKKSGEIKIRLAVSKNVGSEDCKNASYTIKYKYFDPNKEYIGAILKTSDTSKQRFYVAQKVDNGAPLEGQASGVIDCAQEVCETKLQVPICSEDPEDAIARVEAPEKIKKCILDNVDDAGNSYQMTTSNGGVDNDYCKVFCKEDYDAIKLNPVVQNVVCGGYFQLTSHVKGSKDCYTGGDTSKDATNGEKSIDKDQYLGDIIQAQEDMINAYDDYLNYTQAKADTGTQDYYCGSCCGTVLTEYSTTVGGTTYTGYEVSSINEKTGEVVGKFVSGKSHYSASTGRGGCHCKSCGSKEDGTYDSCCSCPSNCDGGSYSDLGLEGKIQSAINRMESAYKRYKQIILDYNSCTTAWTNEFIFEQKLKYYYDEYRYEDVYTPYYDLLEKADNEELYYLEALEDSLIEDSKINVCLGSADENYKCSGSSVDLSGTVDNSSVDEYGYNSAYGGKVFSKHGFTICSKNGCKTDNRDISQASFITKRVEKEQDYITPTAFYQIEANGKITVNSGYAGDDVQLEALINSLPVSTSTTGGGQFKLMLEDFGEFYDAKNELGRLFDFKSNNEDKSVAHALTESGVGTFDGEYVCHYESPCRPDDCPNCDFICDDDGCEWESCPDCDFTCPNCIFNLDELQIIFKTISTTNFNSAGREYGYNWITSSSMQALQLLHDKAEITIGEIEEQNEMIFDDKTGDGSQLAFSVVLKPDVTNAIKRYNDKAEGKGGYLNDSLTCYDATINGKTYKNIYCYSELIDELVEEHSDLVNVKNRLNKNENRADKTGDSGYWTLWDGYIYNESVLGGPSWK